MKLGDMLPSRNPGDKPRFRVRQLGILTMTPDGRHVWSYTKGDRKDSPRPQNILSCSTCAKIGMGISKDGEGEEAKPTVWARDIYPSYKEWRPRKVEGSHWTGGSTGETVLERRTDDGQEVEVEQPRMAAGASPSLKGAARYDTEKLAQLKASLPSGDKTE